MFTTLLSLFGGGLLLIFLNPLSLAITIFQIWMFIHAVRNREWIWALFIFVGWGSPLFGITLLFTALPVPV
jgi:hypothetical protein